MHSDRSHRFRRQAALLLSLSIFALAPAWSEGEQVPFRYQRRFGSEQGLEAGFVRSLAQDQRGYLWVGTVAGLYRFDGLRFRRWMPTTLDREIDALAESRQGEVLALEADGQLVQVTQEGAIPVLGPNGDPVSNARSFAFSNSGELWMLTDDGLIQRDPSGSWHSPPASAVPNEPLSSLRGGAPDGVFALARDGVWEVTGEGPAIDIGRIHLPVDIVLDAHNRPVVLTWWKDLVRFEDHQVHSLVALPGRGVDITRRGDVIWVSWDRYVAAIYPDDRVEVLGPDQIHGPGPLLVDREGSLWLGSFAGLYQMPEPDTGIFREAQGLPSGHARFVERRGAEIWEATWQGVGRLTLENGRWRGTTDRSLVARSRICLDASDRLWAWAEDGLKWVDTRDRVHVARPGLGRAIASCGVDTDGRLWLATDDGLWWIGPTDSEPNLVEGPEGRHGAYDAVYAEPDGTLWVTSESSVCQSELEPVADEKATAWTCSQIPNARHVNALVRNSDGTLWAASPEVGLLKKQGTGWQLVPGIHDLSDPGVEDLVPSVAGGVWLCGGGATMRVEPDASNADGWRVLERISQWHGLPEASSTSLHEDVDGSLWIATSFGLAHVPASARRASIVPPSVEIVEARSDRQVLPLDQTAELPARRNRLELSFAALSFREPGRIRYQVRLRPDEDWSDVNGPPTLRFVDLRPGDYTAEVRASLDGRQWSLSPAWFGFHVDPPWWRVPWVLALIALGVLGLVTALYRYRVSFLLRMERQRTRIAMDLHDEVGAGLGSIGILAGVLAADPENPGRRRELADQIADTAGELGSALSDLVWSLRPRTRTLQQLADRLSEHGSQLFAEGDRELKTRFPNTWPEQELGLGLRRNVLLIGLEALHNAAKHSDASHVEIVIEAVGRDWRLSVIDDGRGLPGSAAETRREGLGLSSMRVRATEIGADIEWSRPAHGGTRVDLVFSLRAQTTRLSRREIEEAMRGEKLP